MLIEASTQADPVAEVRSARVRVTTFPSGPAYASIETQVLSPTTASTVV